MTRVSMRLAAAALPIAIMAGCAGAAAGQAQAGPAPAGGPSAAAPDGVRQPFTAADVRFMTGMIGHHAQAVLMAGWAATHGASPAVRALCERIVVGQNDEIALMQRWLRDRNQPVPAADAGHHAMPGMEHMLMPGMLTADELTRLDRAAGAEFDRLFLGFMIRHHQGALTMVGELIETPGSAREDQLFKFVSDMNADQTIEIERLTGLLADLATAATGP